jgi:hypothetical protein
MPSVFLLGAACIVASALYINMIRKLQERIQRLEQDSQRCSAMMSEMADIQMKTFSKYSSQLEDLEGRIMDLSIPSQDEDLPLERRHQVLALARQGVGLQDIAKRLKAPVGEAGLILNLRKYLDKGKSRPSRMDKQVESHV